MHRLIVSDQKIVMFFFKCILLGIAFISPFCCLTADCANISVRIALHAKLLNSGTYNPHVRPLENSSLPVHVQFRFAPVIHYLVPGNQELQLRGRMVLIWDDHSLAWNPEDYGGLRSLDLPVNKIWQPELIVYERIPTDTELNIQKETEVAKVLSNGTVYWYTMASTRSFCFMNILNFPFDQQNCDVTFTTWMHLKSELLLYHNDDLFINDTYKQNEASLGEWKMTQFHHDPSYRCLYCVKDQSYITYKVTLERYKPLVVLISLLCPCILVIILGFLLPCLPVGDADAATYGLTWVLALVVFLHLLYNLLPSTGVCIIGIGTLVLMVIGTFLTVRQFVRGRCDAGSNGNDTNGREGPQNGTANTGETQAATEGAGSSGGTQKGNSNTGEDDPDKQSASSTGAQKGNPNTCEDDPDKQSPSSPGVAGCSKNDSEAGKGTENRNSDNGDNNPDKQSPSSPGSSRNGSDGRAGTLKGTSNTPDNASIELKPLSAESANDIPIVDAGSNLNDSDGRKGKQDGNPKTDHGASKKRKKIKDESKEPLITDFTLDIPVDDAGSNRDDSDGRKVTYRTEVQH